jgi:hypothetical protein
MHLLQIQTILLISLFNFFSSVLLRKIKNKNSFRRVDKICVECVIQEYVT